MSNEIAKFGKAVVDTTKGNKPRVQFIEAGQASGTFVQAIYVGSIKEAGVSLDDVLTAVSHAWNVDTNAEKPKAQAPKAQPSSTNNALAMVVELYDQGNVRGAKDLAKESGLPSHGGSRGDDGLREKWGVMLNKAGNQAPSDAQELLASLSPEGLQALQKLAGLV